MIRALDHLRKQHPRSEHLRRCAAYYRKHKHRMDYAELKAAGLPIGSGLVEATCKTLVAQRLKLSGMRWGTGAQAILTPREWDQSGRFHEAWALLAAHYRAEVQCSPRTSRSRRPSRRGAGQDENYTLAFHDAMPRAACDAAERDRIARREVRHPDPGGGRS